MRRTKYLAIFGLILALSGITLQGMNMQKYEVELKLAPLKIANIVSVRSIRLVENMNRPHIALLISATLPGPDYQISVVAINDGNIVTQQAPLQLTLTSSFGLPNWDIINTKKGIATTWSRLGSAIAPLVYQKQGDKEAVLAGEDPGGTFLQPRFVRGNSPVAITAIAGSVVALFQNMLASGPVPYVPLPSTGAGWLTDGLLIKQSSGYLLITKIVDGPRGPNSKDSGPDREDVQGNRSISSGILHCLQLDEKLQPIGVKASPIGEVEIYEFDADIVGDKVFLFATTVKGYVTAISNQSMQWSVSNEVLTDGDLLSPSVLAIDKSAIVAVIESKKEFDAPLSHQILLGHF